MGIQLKIEFNMLVTALLSPSDDRKRILLLAVFAFITLC